MSISHPILQIELLGAHPITGAYDADDQLATDQLNALNIPIERTATGLECNLATNDDEFNALSAELKSQWLQICGWDVVDFNNGVAKAASQGIWAGAAGTITRPLLVALGTTNVSRTSQLGFGRSELSVLSITKARAYTNG